MLLAAKAAGEALIEAKKMLAHGQFKQWVEANTKVSYRTAAKYMQLAKLEAKGADLGTLTAVSAPSSTNTPGENRPPRPSFQRTRQKGKPNDQHHPHRNHHHR